MNIIELKIDKIKPDPDQPRTTIEEIDLRAMAQSIVTEGVINPIEVDKKFVIITGERRWRASKIAGLKTVPVKVFDIGADERFMRQVIENIHSETMTDWDLANALKKLLTMGPGDIVPRTPQKGPTADKGITWLSQKTGKSRHYITEKLAILETSKNFQKAVKTNQIPGTYVRALSVPSKYKKIIEKKILNNEFGTRDGALEFTAALNREKENPHIIKKLLDTDYSKFKEVGDVIRKVNEISPRVSELIRKSYEPSQEISKITEKLKEWVMDNPIESIGKIHTPRVIVNLNFIKTLVDKWFEKGKNKLENKK